MLTTAILFDIILLIVLAVFTIHGASRGLLLSLCGLVAMLVAFIGAGFLAGALSPKVADYLEPRFASAIEERLDQEIADSTVLPDQDGDLQTDEIPLTEILNILKDMGFYQSAVDAVNDAVEQGMTEVAANAAAAVAASIAGTVAYMILFVVFFVLILIAWTLISHGLDLVAHLPGLHFLNKTGGAILGLIKGCAILFLCAWVLRYLGKVIPEETVEQTHLLKFFMTTNPVALVLGGLAAATETAV